MHVTITQVTPPPSDEPKPEVTEVWYLSFATDAGFLGVIITPALSFMDAVVTTHRLNINPGGQVAGIGPMLLEDCEPWVAENLNKLLSRADLLRLDGEDPLPLREQIDKKLRLQKGIKVV